MSLRTGLLVFFAAILFFPCAFAQTEPVQAPEKAPVASEDSKPATRNKLDTNYSYAYEKPTLEKLSQLYWALSKFDPKDDKAVDNYLMINECDIYRDYYNNEFEWQNIRKAGREQLIKNRSHLPLRFEIMQPLKLGEYDLPNKRFDILPEYQIKGIRRFEIMADDYSTPVCGFNNGGQKIEGYPRGLLIQLSRPLTLTSVSVEDAEAKAYIQDKLKPFKALQSHQQNQSALYNFRDAYLVMKIKFFSFLKEDHIGNSGMLAEVSGILEAYEVYADPKKKRLLYSESFYQDKSAKARIADKLDLNDTTPMLLDN